MSKPIIVVITHSELSSNRMMHNQLSKITDTSICFFAKFESMGIDNEPLYSLSLLHSTPKNKPLNQEQLIIQENLEKIKQKRMNLSKRSNTSHSDENSHLLNLDGTVKSVFKVAKKLNSQITGNRFYSCYGSKCAATMYILPDVNLTEPGHKKITKPFHDAVHIFANEFYRIYSNLAKVYVNGFSQEKHALEEANSYFEGEEIEGKRLSVNVEHAYASDKMDIKKHLKCENLEIQQTVILPFLTEVKSRRLSNKC